MGRVVAQGDMRPMAASKEAMDDLKRILDGRAAFYSKAEITVDTSGQTPEQSLQALSASVRKAMARMKDAGMVEKQGKDWIPTEKALDDWSRIGGALHSRATTGPQALAGDDVNAHFLLRMRNGMERFRGDLLLLMSGRSLLSREFDVLVQQDAAWQQALRSPRHRARHDLPDADQAFSSIAARAEVAAVTRQWLADPGSLSFREPAE